MESKLSVSPLEEKALAQFKRGVLDICGAHPPSLQLFGSRARGEGNEDSDVDVLILLPIENEGHKIKIWDLAYEVFDKTGIQISPFVLTSNQFASLESRERRIAREIARDGIAL